MTNENDASKLIIDEDWKTQVQREKAELEKRKAAEAQSAEEQATNEPDGEAQTVGEKGSAIGKDATSQGEDHPADLELPPASLMLLITSLGTQAMASLGLMPGPDGGLMPVDLTFAKHFIDLLSVVEEKTKGNLTDEESNYLQETLYQLRMAFIEVKKNA